MVQKGCEEKIMEVRQTAMNETRNDLISYSQLFSSCNYWRYKRSKSGRVPKKEPPIGTMELHFDSNTTDTHSLTICPSSEDFYIGEGFYSIVFRGTSGGRSVVVKLYREIRYRDAIGGGQTHAFDHEFQILKGLGTTNRGLWPTLIGCGSIQEAGYLVYQYEPDAVVLENCLNMREESLANYCSGTKEEDILDLIKKYNKEMLPHYERAVDVVDIAMGCIEVVQTALSRGVVHGDIRSSNILLRMKPSLSVSFIDWGSSVLLDSEKSIAALKKDIKGIIRVVFLITTNKTAIKKKDLMKNTHYIDQVWGSNHGNRLSDAIDGMLGFIDGVGSTDYEVLFDQLAEKLQNARGIAKFPIIYS